MNQDPARIPVIVGVGQINDRPADPADGLDPPGLMAAALRAADADAGGGWLEEVDNLALVDQISFRQLNPLTDKVAALLGIDPAQRSQTPMPMGDSPIRLLNAAANAIGAGEATVCAVVGAEALRTAAQRRAAATGKANAEYKLVRNEKLPPKPSYQARYGLAAPVDLYPLYENATRAAWGQTLEEGQRESGVIWASFSRVAAANPGAWLRQPREPDEITTPSLDNRPIAFPFTKMMVANSSVNQGAGFIVTSLAHARARGVPEDRLIYVGNGAAAREPADILARDAYDRSGSMEVTLEKALEINGLTPADIGPAELYSCFPCVPKMARRTLGWDADRPASVFGGLTFGGGPIGNYMSHAVVSMVERLRAEPGTGLLFGNGGAAPTYNHTIVVSSRPIAGAAFPRDFDFQSAADARRGPVPPLAEDYEGEGTIETYTVFYRRDGAPEAGLVVARNPEGARFLARVAADDDATIAFLTDGRREPVGTQGHASRGDDGLVYWRQAA